MSINSNYLIRYTCHSESLDEDVFVSPTAEEKTSFEEKEMVIENQIQPEASPLENKDSEKTAQNLTTIEGKLVSFNSSDTNYSIEVVKTKRRTKFDDNRSFIKDIKNIPNNLSINPVDTTATSTGQVEYTKKFKSRAKKNSDKQSLKLSNNKVSKLFKKNSSKSNNESSGHSESISKVSKLFKKSSSKSNNESIDHTDFMAYQASKNPKFKHDKDLKSKNITNQSSIKLDEVEIDPTPLLLKTEEGNDHSGSFDCNLSRLEETPNF